MSSGSAAEQGAATIGDAYLPDSGNGGYAVTHYDLELTYRPGANRLDGYARITLVAAQRLRRFSLDLSELKPSKVQVGGRAAQRFGVRGAKLLITTAEPIEAGRETVVQVRYSGNPKPRHGAWGSVGWEELADGALVAAQPNGAPTWFPCNDHPSDKATYRIALTVDSPYRVLANGTLSSRTAGASMTTWVYEQNEPMATYLATVQIGRYEEFALSGEPVDQRAVLPASLRSRFAHDFARQPEIMSLFERLFGPYPHPRYTVVVTPDALEIPLEAHGISVFGSNHVDGEASHERLIAHELAHQWFGNSLTVASWPHIWLNEGFACYAEWLWSEHSGDETADELARHYWTRLSDQPQDFVLSDPGLQRMFDDRLYKRGALTLHALRLTLGDAAFFDLLRTWTRQHAHGLVTTGEFVAAAATFDAAAGESLAPWLYEKQLPAMPAMPALPAAPAPPAMPAARRRKRQ